MKKNRQYGLDILRVMAMLLITAIHYIAYSGIVDVSELTGYNRIFLSCVSALFVAAVNLFILITGYFSCEKKINVKRLFTLWISTVLAGIILLAVGVLILKQPFGMVTLIKTILPFSTMHYWFFTMYVLLMIASPLLNILIDHLTQHQHKVVCVIGFFLISVFLVSNPFINAQYYIADARGIVWLSYLYIIGAGFKKYSWSLTRWKNILGICMVYVLLVILQLFQVSHIGNCQLLDSNSVLPFLLSLLLFSLFKSIDIKCSVSQKVVSSLSSCSFLVYILQEHDIIRFWYWDFFKIPSYAASPLLFVNFLISLLALWPIALLLQCLFNVITPGITFIYTRVDSLMQKLFKIPQRRKNP